MKQKSTVILPLATALASLSGAAHAAVPSSQAIDTTTVDIQAEPNTIKPNTIYKTGEDLLGLLVTKTPDNTVVAQHASHYSHSSHASHASSRY